MREFKEQAMQTQKSLLTQHRTMRLMRRLEQMTLAHEHFKRVLASGERPLSSLELWRIENFADHLSSLAGELRRELAPDAEQMLDCSGPDIPGIIDVPVRRSL
jgi:hypothetical protein